MCLVSIVDSSERKTNRRKLLAMYDVHCTQQPNDIYSTNNLPALHPVGGQRLYVCLCTQNVCCKSWTIRNIFYIFIRKMQWHDDKTKFIWSGNINNTVKCLCKQHFNRGEVVANRMRFILHIICRDMVKEKKWNASNGVVDVVSSNNSAHNAHRT